MSLHSDDQVKALLLRHRDSLRQQFLAELSQYRYDHLLALDGDCPFALPPDTIVIRKDIHWFKANVKLSVRNASVHFETPIDLQEMFGIECAHRSIVLYRTITTSGRMCCPFIHQLKEICTVLAVFSLLDRGNTARTLIAREVPFHPMLSLSAGEH